MSKIAKKKFKNEELQAIFDQNSAWMLKELVALLNVS